MKMKYALKAIDSNIFGGNHSKKLVLIMKKIRTPKIIMTTMIVL